MAKKDRLFNNPKDPVNRVREDIAKETGPMTGIVTDGYNEISAQIAKNHHENSKTKSDKDRVVYAKKQTKEIPTASNLKLIRTGNQDNFDPANYGKPIVKNGESLTERLNRVNAEKYEGKLFKKLAHNPFLQKWFKRVATFALVGTMFGFGAAQCGLLAKHVYDDDANFEKPGMIVEDPSGNKTILTGEEAEELRSVLANSEAEESIKAMVQEAEAITDEHNATVKYGVENNHAPMPTIEENGHSRGGR